LNNPAALAFSPAAGLLVASQGTNVLKWVNDQGAVRAINLEVEAIPHRVDVELESARLVSGNIVHAADANGLVVITQVQPLH